MSSEKTIWVRHDDTVERPEFLVDYEDTGDDIKLGNTTLSLFRRTVAAGTIIVMAGNSDGRIPDEASMYVVFAKAQRRRTAYVSNVPQEITPGGGPPSARDSP